MTPSVRTGFRSVASVSDFVLRLAFFVVAPLLLVFLTAYWPLGGALANVGIILGVFFFASAIRPLAEKRPWIKKMLGRQLAFEAYYRARPPRHFLYYAFYPFLFPYWLTNREARREVMLFRGYTAFTSVLLVVGGAWQYFTKWRPELGIGPFLRVLVGTTIVEILITIGMLMPVATTVVTYHLAGRRRRLAVLLFAASLAVVVGVGALMKKRHEIVGYVTTDRMELRSKAQPAHARVAMEDALRRAWRTIVQGDAELEHDYPSEVEILGAPIDRAREALSLFYKDDETHCFHLVEFELNAQSQPGKKMFGKRGKLLVLFAERVDEKQKPIWLGLRGRGTIVSQETELPKNAFGVMRNTAKR